MHIVSYRGPGMSGGVSSALARAWECNQDSDGLWWHLADNEVRATAGLGAAVDTIARVPADLVQGHYRYCNDFLWPVLHDLPQFASYSAESRSAYNAFNQTLGWCLTRSWRSSTSNNFFVQDYQMALVPRILKNAGMRSLVFWHIPWPEQVEEGHAGALADIARGLLSADVIGFHTEEYAQNFMAFVREHLEGYGCNTDTKAVWSIEQRAESETLFLIAPGRQRVDRAANRGTRRITRLVVAPLGIDFNHWQTLSARQRNTLWHPKLMRTPFILSVDRADYTKGVVERIEGIDRFFEKYPQWTGKISFAQICGKTRGGLSSFDEYWQQSQQAYDRLTQRWQKPNWQPVLWIEKSFEPPDLAHAYATASGMLISAVRDGLNLTAKEYVACQHSNPGVLLLSKGTGAHDELGKHCLTIEPENKEQVADALNRALTMDTHERTWRMTMLKDSVRGNTLNKWWRTFSDLMRERRSPALELRETS